MSPLLALIALQTPTLKVGDPAPALTVSTWLKGTPNQTFEKGNVYVVEFWATWCGPCKANMPHLSELARKLEGKAKVIGVDVWERPPTTEADVRAFVEKMGKRMDYNVVRDDAAGSMSKHWLRAAGRNGIPSAFVVGRDGKIAWIGHPASRMAEVLDAVVADRFDPAAEAVEQAKFDAERKEQLDMLLAYRKTVVSGDMEKAEKDLSLYLAAHPNAEKSIWSSKYQTLLSSNERAAYEYATTLSKGMLKEDAQGLYFLSVMILSAPGVSLKNPDLALALRLAEQAAALPITDSRTYVITTLATAQQKNGHPEKAKELLKKEIARLESLKDQDPDMLKAAKAAFEALP